MVEQSDLAYLHFSVYGAGDRLLLPSHEFHNIFSCVLISRGKEGQLVNERDDREALKKQVIADLKEYPVLKRKLALLQFERSHPPKITEDDVIDGMALSRPIDDTIRQTSYISNKTMRIAMEYQDRKDYLNHETMREIVDEMTEVEASLQKLEFYVSQLEPKQAEVIQLHYFEGITWAELQKKLYVTSRALLKRRDSAIEELVSMYRYLGRIKGKLYD